MELKEAIDILKDRYLFDEGTLCDGESDFSNFVKKEMDAIKVVLLELKQWD